METSSSPRMKSITKSQVEDVLANENRNNQLESKIYKMKFSSSTSSQSSIHKSANQVSIFYLLVFLIIATISLCVSYFLFYQQSMVAIREQEVSEKTALVSKASLSQVHDYSPAEKEKLRMFEKLPTHEARKTEMKKHERRDKLLINGDSERPVADEFGTSAVIDTEQLRSLLVSEEEEEEEMNNNKPTPTNEPNSGKLFESLAHERSHQIKSGAALTIGAHRATVEVEGRKSKEETKFEPKRWPLALRRKRFAGKDSGPVEEIEGTNNSETINSTPPVDTVKVTEEKKEKPQAIERKEERPRTTTTTTTTMDQVAASNETATTRVKCRIEKNLYLDFDEYKQYTCAMCYGNIKPSELFLRKLQFRKPKWLYDEQQERHLLANETEQLRTTFREDSTFYKWLECCNEAIKCCQENGIYLPLNSNQTTTTLDDEPSDTCPATWDGLSCWPRSPAGKVATRECPNHVYFLDFVPICKGQVRKQCFSNGSWFIRHDHEWSDFNDCASITLYATRLLIGSIWHFFAAIVMTPALIVLHHFPNRAGSKRVKILIYLLYWIMFNSIFTGSQKIGIMSGLFHKERPYQQPPVEQSFSPRATYPSNAFYYSTNNPFNNNNNNNNNSIQPQQQLVLADTNKPSLSEADKQRTRRQITSAGAAAAAAFAVGQLKVPPTFAANFIDNPASSGVNKRPYKQLAQKPSDEDEGYASDESDLVRGQAWPPVQVLDETRQLSAIREPATVTSYGSVDLRKLDDRQLDNKEPPPSLSGGQNTKRNSHQVTTLTLRRKRDIASRFRKKSHPLAIVLCWLVSVGGRVSRLFFYSWMFTGGVYLCSVLHFAPAEPPAKFIKLLMLLTNCYPIVTAVIYLTLRTYYEASPINLLYLLPYYYYTGDNEAYSEAMKFHLNCWFNDTKYRYIEEIAILPNLVLVILNFCLFIVTLIIMCRITRPGSTRADMSLGNYFKAAGTLVVLYGAHYSLLAHRPDLESLGCVKGQMLYYLILFVDGYQGIAVSYVFCYRTPEGKEIIVRWWRSVKERMPDWLCTKQPENHPSRERNLLNASNRSNHSTRSNNSICNGKDVTTELIDINDTQVTNRFNP